MDIQIDSKTIYTLSPVQLQVIGNTVPAAEVTAYITNILTGVVQGIYQQAFDQLQAQGNALLVTNKIASIPLDPDAYAQLVFSQPNYVAASADPVNQPTP